MLVVSLALVLVVSHCIALLRIDRVVDVLSQSICMWMIHHCDTLLNATQCGHVCHHLQCEPKWHGVTTSPFVRHHTFSCSLTQSMVLCAVWSRHAFCIHSPCGMVNHHHSMIGSWCLWFIHQINVNALKQCGDEWPWCQWWCPWLGGLHCGHVWMCSFTSSFTPGHQWL